LETSFIEIQEQESPEWRITGARESPKRGSLTATVIGGGEREKRAKKGLRPNRYRDKNTSLMNTLLHYKDVIILTPFYALLCTEMLG
jgi:hypothetical protein